MGVGNIEVTVTNGGTVVVRGSGPLAVSFLPSHVGAKRCI